MKPKPFLALALIFTLFFLPRPSPAGDEKARKSGTLTLYLENDPSPSTTMTAITPMEPNYLVGWNIPNDFGTYLIRPGSDSSAPEDDEGPRFFRPFHRFGIHLFFAVDGNAVARNIFLDGTPSGRATASTKSRWSPISSAASG